MKSSILFLVLLLLIPTTKAQWQKQLSGTTEDLNDVDVLNQTTTVVVGNNGTILKTTDNGLSWILKNSNTSNNLNAVSFRNDECGIIVGNGVICRTSDGGENWSVNTYTDNFITIYYRNPYFGIPIIIGSDNGKVLYSYDDGNSWCDTVLSPNEQIIAVGFNYSSPSLHSPLVYTATTFYTAITLSPCSYWCLFDNPINPVWDILTGGEFYDGSQYLIGWMGNPGPDPLLLRRNGSDTSWIPTYSFVPPPYIPEDITSIGEVLFVCGSDNKIFKSTDRGDNWFEQTTGINEDLSAISFWNELIGYSVGKEGTILFTSNGGISSVEEMQPPSGYKLFQNYPNPCNPVTYIRFRIAEFGFVLLKVYDILGREIATLFDEEKPAGEYETEFSAIGGSAFGGDAYTLPSGVYVYKISAGNFTEIKKMTLAK